MDELRRLRVLMSTPAIRKTTNPYIVQLIDSVREVADVQLFSWRTALIGRYDVIHIHWPENFTKASGWLRRGVRRVLVTALQVRLSISRIAIVRTAHNERPHENCSAFDEALLRRWDRRTDLWVTLNPRTQTPTEAPSMHIPHGHYRDWFASYVPSPARKRRASIVGHLRPYKGVEDLLRAFAQDHPSDIELVVAGQPSDKDFAGLLAELAMHVPEAALELGFVDDDRLVEIITSSSLVVLPYRNMHNSGVALLALSLGRPVLVPDNEVARDLRDEVGNGWVHPFRSSNVVAALENALSSGIPQGAPDLSAREWSATAREHLQAYREALQHRNRRRSRVVREPAQR